MSEAVNCVLCTIPPRPQTMTYIHAWLRLTLICATLCEINVEAWMVPAKPLPPRTAVTNNGLSQCGSSTSMRSGKENEDQSLNPVTKASWYAVEAFGKIFGQKNEGASTTSDIIRSTDAPPQSVQETMARIKTDNEREYFLSGEIDKLIYDEQCEFADPFVSFKGRDRFIENLENLGSFITEYSAKPLSYQELPDNAVQTKFMVKLRLNLPWKPVLAWPWGVRCQIDPETCLVVLHEETWDIDAWEGVKQIFRKPTTIVK